MNPRKSKQARIFWFLVDYFVYVMITISVVGTLIASIAGMGNAASKITIIAGNITFIMYVVMFFLLGFESKIHKYVVITVAVVSALVGITGYISLVPGFSAEIVWQLIQVIAGLIIAYALFALPKFLFYPKE